MKTGKISCQRKRRRFSEMSSRTLFLLPVVTLILLSNVKFKHQQSGPFLLMTYAFTLNSDSPASFRRLPTIFTRQRKPCWNPTCTPILFSAVSTSTAPPRSRNQTNIYDGPTSELVAKSSDQLDVITSDVYQGNDIARPTENGGYTHTSASKAKISAANKGKTPWNKGKSRSDEVRARIAAGVRAKNRERFLQKLQDLGLTEEEYEKEKAETKAKKAREKSARKTENGGYRPTEETKQKISAVLKEKWAKGDIKKRSVDPSKVRRGFKHSEETRRKISESLKKRWETDEDYRLNMANKTLTSNVDSSVRQKISESLRKKWQDPEFRASMLQKMSKRKDNGNRNEEHRAKISATMKAKWQDEDYRKRTLGAMAKRHEETVKTNPSKARRASQLDGAPRFKPTKSMRTSSQQKKAKASSIDGDSIEARPREPNKVQPKSAKGTATRNTTKKKQSPLSTAASATPAKRKVSKKDAKTSGSRTGKDIVKKNPTVESMEPGATDTETKKTKRKKQDNGSVSRLREERRDLYDLLYGDDDSENESVVSSSKNKLRSVFLDDDNLDDFDPYGLEDF